MTALTDADIRDAIDGGDMDIDPFHEAQLTPNGYDLAMAEVVLPDTGHRFVAGRAVVPPLTRFMVSTVERVRLGPSLSGQLWLRTSWARRGVIASFGRIDAGFDGTLTFGAFNSSADPLEVPLGETFAQLVLEPMSRSVEAGYDERSGHYQHQKGVTMASDRGPVEGRSGEGGSEGPARVHAPCLERDCHECCVDTEMPLAGRDVEHLRSRGHDVADFTISEDGFTFLANVDGSCYFLDPEGRCIEYEDRPEGCRLYPLVLDEEMADFTMDHLCPHAEQVSVGPDQERALMELLDRIAREREHR
jgi:dCTP deaminase